MKRHPALIPLSRDHHHGLVQASRPRHAAADGDASARLATAREFVEFFGNEERVRLRAASASEAPERHTSATMSPIQTLQKITIRIPAITSAPPSVRPAPFPLSTNTVLLRRGDENGPAWTRTRDQPIMSRLL